MRTCLPALYVKMNKSWTLSFLCAVFCTTVFVVDCDSSPAAAINECSAVRTHFIKHKLGHHNIIPEQKIHDADMQICYRGSSTSDDRKSCCTHKMEDKYSHEAERHYAETLKSTSAYLQDLLKKNAEHYQEKVLHLLSLAEKNTRLLFSQMYQMSPQEHHGPIAYLFKDLRSYTKLIEVNLHESVSTFFDKLFPQVFHNILNDPKYSDGLTSDFKECLTDLRQRLQPHPFGDIPHKLSSELTRAMSTSRLLMDTLNIGIKTINTTNNLNLDSQCIHALTRLKYCSHCEGHVTARPCHGFCLNVMRGCLAATTELDSHWNALVDAMESLVKNLKGNLDIEHVLKGMHSRVSEAVMHAMDTGPKFYAQVVTRCGYPKSLSKSDKTTKTAATTNIDKKTTSEVVLNLEEFEKVKLGHRLQVLVSNLIASKGFYHGLADTMCSANMYASRAGHACWNGTALAQYNNTVSAIGLTAQLNHNPEMRVMRGRQTVLVSVMNDLIHMKKLMASKASSEQMQADQYNVGRTYYYGSGQGDDEDDGGSGSGAGGSGGGSNDHAGVPIKSAYQPDNQSPDIYIDQNADSNSRKDNKSTGHMATISIYSIATLTSLLFTARWLNG